MNEQEPKQDKRIRILRDEKPAKAVVRMGVPLIARSLGAGEREKAEHALTSGMVLTAVNGMTVTLAGLLFLPQIVSGLGADADTFAYTAQYTETLLRSEGSVRYAVAGMLCGTAANVVLDPLFIFGFGMQVRGAAIATVLGNAVSTGVSLLLYARGKTLLQPHWKYRVPTKEVLGEIFYVGVPASLETLLTTAAYIVNNNLAAHYSALHVTATGLAQKIMTLGTYVYQGFASGTQPLMGYNYGAKNYRRMLSVLRAGLLIVSGTELCIMAVYAVFAPQLIGIFTQTPAVIALGSRALRTVMWILPFVGAVSMSRMSFQAMGKPLSAFVITLVRQLFLYVPLLLILDRCFGFSGMLWAQPVTEAVMTVFAVRLLVRTIRGAMREAESA
ncbi:MAG: polysaccharide biosynthesis C-terminal domain-containing protein [Oscillospiraceae bacterium]|nr:polysaccharide biosynthesis C-terminal domain-containing protein [Oscillospiraceae bacterium]